MVQRNARLNITHGQLAILLVNFLNDVVRNGGTVDGYHNVSKTLPEFLRELEDSTAKVTLPVTALEDLLYGANMENENKSFWHPAGASFDGFVDRLLGPARIDGASVTFDREYNLLK